MHPSAWFVITIENKYLIILYGHNLYSLLCCSVYLRRNCDTQFKSDIKENLNLSIQPNPSYNYAYQVSDDESQTYIAHQEGREDNVVTGEYSYVDPFGALITVTYIADSNGYREERKSQPNFVQIRALPVARAVIPQPAPEPAPVRRVVVAKPAPAPVRRIVPAAPVRTVVPARTAPAVVPAPIVREVVDVEKVANIFGTGGSNNVKFASPDSNFAFDL